MSLFPDVSFTCAALCFMWALHKVTNLSCVWNKCKHRYNSLGPISIRRFQQTLSLNLNSELTYSEMGNSEFSVPEQLNWVSLLNSKSVDSELSACSITMKSHDQWSGEITIHHGNSSRQKDVSKRTSVNAWLQFLITVNKLITVIILKVKTVNYWTNIHFNGIPCMPTKKGKRQEKETRTWQELQMKHKYTIQSR